jgi:hypothetical protein
MASPDNILEITHLNVVDHISPSHPSILQNLQQARTLLAAKVHPTHSHFYQDLRAPEKIFILGTWPSIERHQEFLGNAALKADVLGGQEDSMLFGWSAHVSLRSSWIAKGGIGQAIKSAKVVGIQRIRVTAEKVEKFQNILSEEFWNSLQRVSSHEVLFTWNLDCEEKAVREYIILTIWSRRSDEDSENVYRKQFEQLGKEFRDCVIDEDLRFMKDMEGLEEESVKLPVS